MRVTVAGLWHLGCVTAAGLTSVGHHVTGYDPDASRLQELRQGRLPVHEPGLEALLREGLASGRLGLTTDSSAAADAEAVWIALDTPLDEEDRADVAPVRALIDGLAGSLAKSAPLLISSQVPVGFTRSVERAWPALRVSYSPENLRLGSALETFLRPARVLVGVRRPAERRRLQPLFRPLRWRISWVSVESAEMAKHALNAFLATSVAFANELARLCEATGADAREVEAALRSDARVGARAYLAPGGPVSGGTLARELRFLSGLAQQHAVAAPLVEGTLASNRAHLDWLIEVVSSRLRGLERPVCAVLGLVYKPGTDTLRRSASLELCERLVREAVELRIHDPAVRERPPALAPQARVCARADEALAGADLAVIATPWPEYRALGPDVFHAAMRRPRVIDPGGLLAESVGRDTRIEYVAAGRSAAAEAARPARPGRQASRRSR